MKKFLMVLLAILLLNGCGAARPFQKGIALEHPETWDRVVCSYPYFGLGMLFGVYAANAEQDTCVYGYVAKGYRKVEK